MTSHKNYEMRYYQPYGHTVYFTGQTENTFKIIKIINKDFKSSD
jgi:hypothetical protein